MKIIKTLLAAALAFSALLSCTKNQDPYMTLSDKELTIGSDGGILTLDVKSNVYYRVNNDCNFLVVSEGAQEGDTRTYILDVKTNALTESRSEYIRFIGDNVTPLRVLVTQNAYVPYGVDKDKISAAWEDTDASFEILGEKSWTAQVDNDWFTLSQTSGETGGKVKLAFQANETDTPQEAVITVTINGEDFQIEVKQKAKFATSVEPETLTPIYDDTRAEFEITSVFSWTVTSDNPEFVPNPTSGTGNATVEVTFPENESEQSITATVTVTVGSNNYPVTIIQGGSPKKEFKDLSASGTSNCYIVSETAYYKFKATVRGNGVVPESQNGFSAAIAPASVKVLWSTFNTDEAPADDEAVISRLELVDGYVQFLYKGRNAGNAIIAAYDASGVIIWSWHIWATAVGSDIQLGNDYWMDRNLGALAPSVKGTTDGLAAGFFYEWGRKDPFRCSYTFDPGTAANIATTGTWPELAVVKEGCNIASSIANPQAYWYVSGKSHNSKDWIWGEQFNDLWGAGPVASGDDLSAYPKTTKTLFDPCPPGYCVPTSQQFKNAGTSAGITKKDIAQVSGTEIYGIGNSTFYIVYAGGLAYDSGKLNGPVGQYSWYATSCTNGVNQMCARSHTTAFNWGGASSARSCGYSVRCIKE